MCKDALCDRTILDRGASCGAVIFCVMRAERSRPQVSRLGRIVGHDGSFARLARASAFVTGSVVGNADLRDRDNRFFTDMCLVFLSSCAYQAFFCCAWIL